MSLEEEDAGPNVVPTETNTRESETDMSGFASDNVAPAGGSEQIHLRHTSIAF